MSTGVAQAAGAFGALGLALLVVATRRDLRVAGLAAWALGCAGLTVYLAPHGHHRLLAAAADAYVPPSLAEAFPFTLLEAAARGLPIVSTSVGGIPELITDGINGWLVPPNDPVRLAEAMLALQSDPNHAATLAGLLRQRVMAGFLEHHMVAATARIYREALGIVQIEESPDRSNHGTVLRP